MDTVPSMKPYPVSNNHSGHRDSDAKPENHTVDMKEEMTYTSSAEDLKRAAKESILKRIPLGAEATTVLVGAVDFLEQPTIAFVRLAEGILMPSITEQFHKIAYKADERKELLSAINEFLDDSIVLPPGDWERKALLPFGELKAKSEMIRRRKNTRLLEQDETQKALLLVEGASGKPPPDDYDPLRRTRIPFGGMINDIKRRYPFYKSDIIDGCNLQSIAAAIFMYFAALSGAITFGGLMGDKTNNLIGISETLVSTSAAGIVFALVSGQPMIIIGTTGPLLLFDESLYSFCVTNEFDFLTVRVYIGIWLGIIGIIVVCFEGSVLVKLFTRFTEEIFAALISILYIVESIVKLFVVFDEHPLMSDYCSDPASLNDSMGNQTFLPRNDSQGSADSIYSNNNLESLSLVLSEYSLPSNNTTMNDRSVHYQTFHHDSRQNQPNTALFCLILALGTFFIAYYLRQFRNSKFLGRSLQVPEGLSPSNPEVRGWIITPGVTHVWLMFAAAAPALLVYILLFMETHICELIIDKKERKLKKGAGFHLDIVVVCLTNVGCGFLGAPWQCAATVRSIAHVSALTVMSRTHAPGDKPHIIEVKEQRLSALLVSVFVGVSVLMAPLLRLVPMAVLFGVFLYMGISSTNGIQFFDRLRLFFMPVKHHPQVPYVRRVHSMKMHLFTIIQLLCLALLWVVKSTEASLAFPFFLILMVPLRAQLRYVFTPLELRALDSEEADADAEDEPDFYTEAPLPG
ncbi:Anion exchange protein 2 [Blattella germanica]|nr:Anion exchange protein 2 [Blattella germanica]